MGYKIAVIGGGLIGASWAALFAARGGHHVVGWDPNAEVLSTFCDRAQHARRQLNELYPDAGGTITTEAAIADAVGGAEWIQENAPESLPLKLELYREIERLAPAETPVATSTSSLLWSALAVGFQRPGRLLSAHPFNPPHLMPLVEIFSGDDPTAKAGLEFYSALGHRPIRLKREAAGHIANRLASALWREAVNIVAEGIADVGDVDAALIDGPALRWSLIGTHMGYHLGGGAGGIRGYLKHLGPSQERRWADLGTPKLTPELCDQLAEGIDREAAGRSIEELEAERDRKLIATLKLRQAQGGAAS